MEAQKARGQEGRLITKNKLFMITKSFPLLNLQTEKKCTAQIQIMK